MNDDMVEIIANLKKDEEQGQRDESENEENSRTKSKGYYEALGMCRYTLILGKEHKTKLHDLAKKYGVTQGVAIEVLLENIDEEKLAPTFALKTPKAAGRPGGQEVKQRDLHVMLKGMTPEQLVAVQAAIQAVKTPKETA